MIKPGTRLLHYKNLPYQFLFYAKHSESLEEVAVYECLYDNPRGRLWVRPRAMFEEHLPGSEPPKLRFAPVGQPDDKNQVERMSGCSAGQEQGLAARYNMRCWEILDQAISSTSAAALAEALECGYAALALTRLRGTPLEMARCHWLVALVALRFPNAQLAMTHAVANRTLIEESESATEVDVALSFELQARLASVSRKTQREISTLKDRALAAIESISNDEERERCLHFFEQPPW